MDEGPIETHFDPTRGNSAQIPSPASAGDHALLLRQQREALSLHAGGGPPSDAQASAGAAARSRPMIIDFGEEKKRRRRYATLNDLMAEAMQTLRHVGVHAEGIFFVMKVPGSDGPQYQYLQ